MKTKEEYDQNLLQFYSNTFKDYLLQNGLQKNILKENDAEIFANKALKEYGTTINNNIAAHLLHQINKVSPTLEDAVSNYPSMYWQTKEGHFTFNKLAKQITDKISNEIVEDIMKLPENAILNKDTLQNHFKEVMKIANEMAKKEYINSGEKVISLFENQLRDMMSFSFSKLNFNEQGNLQVLNEVVINVYQEQLDDYKKNISNVDSNPNTMKLCAYLYKHIKKITDEMTPQKRLNVKVI